MTEPNKRDSRYNVLLGALCVNAKDDNDEEKFVEFPFSFKGKSAWELSEDCGYDDLNDQINNWLQRNGYEGWFMDDEAVLVDNQDSVDPRAVMID